MLSKRMLKFLIIVLFPITLNAQTERWKYQYNNSPYDGDDRPSCIVYGTDGNIYTAGYSQSSTNDDLLVLSLTTAGDTNWTYRYNNAAANSFDRAYSIAYGADNNIYTTGVSVGGGTSVRDLIVISLSNSTGDTNWTYRYDAGFSTYDEGHDIVFGSDGNTYIAGWTDNDFFTILSLDNTGGERWFNIYDYTGSYDIAHSLVYGSDGNIYAAGFSLGNASDILVVSVDASGNFRWDYTYNGPGNSADSAYAIIYGADNNLYIAGTSYDNTTDVDFTVVSLDNAGNERWVYTYNNENANGKDRAFSIVYGTDGNIYVAGDSYGTNTNYDFTIISLDTDGMERWVHKDSTFYFGSWNRIDRAKAIEYGADNNLYIGGVSGSLGSDFTVISVTNTGIQNWLYKPNFSAYDEANSIVYGGDGYVYAAGYRFITGFPIDDYDLVVISLEGGVTASEDLSFYAISEDFYVNLFWSVNMEQDCLFYLITKNTVNDNDSYYEIARIPGSGSSPAPKTYTYRDRDVKPGERYYYKLGVVKKDGTKWFGPVSSVVTEIKEYLKVSPNPFSTSTTITLSLPSTGHRAESIELKVYDISGRLVKSIPLTTNHLSLGTDLKTGVYFLEFSSGEYKTTRKLLKVK